MSIPLPPLPQRIITMYVEGERGTYPIYKDGYTESQLRARDLEVARVVLEAAAKVCEHWSNRNHVYVNGALRCGKDIRALEVTHHE